MNFKDLNYFLLRDIVFKQRFHHCRQNNHWDRQVSLERGFKTGSRAWNLNNLEWQQIHLKQLPVQWFLTKLLVNFSFFTKAHPWINQTKRRKRPRKPTKALKLKTRRQRDGNFLLSGVAWGRNSFMVRVLCRRKNVYMCKCR